jgi:hypothetical protein
MSCNLVTELALPKVIGDDSIIRFVAQKSERDQPDFNQVPVSWVDMGSLVVLAQESCRTTGIPATSTTWGPLLAFCDGYKWLYEEAKEKPSAANAYARLLKGSDQLPWAGQGVGLSYDAAGLFIRAVRENQIRPSHVDREYTPHRGAIAQELREGKEFEGATGVITFQSSRIGERRNLAILNIANISDVRASPICEYLVGDTYSIEAAAYRGCPS